MLVGMLNTLNSWPNAIEWGRLALLALLDFSDDCEISVSVLCRESTELRLPEIFLWACLMDRKKRAEAWRMKPNLWPPFSASSSIHAPNKPEIEQTSDSIYNFRLVKYEMSNCTEKYSVIHNILRNCKLNSSAPTVTWSAWRSMKLCLAPLSRSQTNWTSFSYHLNPHMQIPRILRLLQTQTSDCFHEKSFLRNISQFSNFPLGNVNCC